MQPSIHVQVLALAAIAQAISQVQAIARGEITSPRDIATCLQSIAEQNPTDAIDIYGGQLRNLQNGYKILQQHLTGNGVKDVEITRYGMAVLILEKALSANADVKQAIGRRIERLQQQLQHFQITDDTLIASIADIYVEHISPLGNRIQVAGSPDQLKQTAVQQKIRALLLAAVRGAVLWRQAGGRRYHFLLNRKALLQEISAVLQQLKTS